MRVFKMTASRRRTYTNTDQEGLGFYTDAFYGIKAAVIVALIVFWIPLVAIYLIFGWRYDAVYILTIMVTTACLTRFRFKRRHLMSKERGAEIPFSTLRP